MGSELSADQLEELKSGNACVVRNPISVSYGEEPLEFTSIEAGSTICVAGTDLAVLETLDGYEGYLRFLYKGIIINHNKNRANLH